MASSAVREIRPATDDDVAAIRAILAAHGNDGPVVNADVVGPYIRHLIERGGARVAVEGNEVVGFGAAVDTGRSVHLADLFVRLDRLGQGIGRPLLAAVLGDATRRTTCASEDPRALPLYVRAGMQPLWALIYIEGSAAAIPTPPPSIRTESATADELAGLELAWTGLDRAADHRFWSGQPQADPFIVRDGGEVVAFGSARVRQATPIRVLDRLVIHPDAAADTIAVMLAAFSRAGRGGPTMSSVFGPNPVLRPLLELGFRIVDRDQFMTSDPGLVDPARFIPNPGML